MKRIACILATAIVLALAGFDQTAPAATTVAEKTYRVRKGNNLTWIADKNNVGLEAMLLANETMLKQKYDDVCGDLSRGFRNRRGDRGTQRGGQFYCNDRFRRPYGNTLQPGWILAVPTDAAPADIKSAISNLKGKKIALVIDDTGSMNDDRQKVSQFYLAALREQKSQIAGVWLYADGRIRRYRGGSVEFMTSGGFENTFGALKAAAAEKPDAIVLVTDEPGDDWNWGGVKSFPPVVAHCLAQNGYAECQKNLERLAGATKGRYMTGLGR